MQKLRKFDFKINVKPSELKNYMNFSTNDRLVFIDTFQFLSSSLDNLRHIQARNLMVNYKF